MTHRASLRYMKGRSWLRNRTFRADEELNGNSSETTTTTTTTAEPIASGPDAYLSLTVEEAGDLADSRGKVWRVTRIDGVDQRVTADLAHGRLNFHVENGIVVDVIEEQIPTAPTTTAEPPTMTITPVTTTAVPDPTTTTTTTEVPPNPTSPESYISLTVEAAGNLATSNGIEWRVVREDGEDFEVTADFVPGRLNFSVINGLVSSVEVETEAPIATTPLGNWTVESVIVDGVEIVHPSGFQALIIDENSASGHDNSWGGKTVQWDESGTFALTGNTTSTSQLCPTGTESTAAYNQALRQATTWEITAGGALILSGPGGRIVLS